MLVCEKCGGSNIQILAWVDANTNEYKEEHINDINSKWCENCKEHINLINEEEYNKEN